MTGTSINTNIVLGGRILAFLGGHVGVEVNLVKFYEIKMMKLEETKAANYECEQLTGEMQTCGAI